MAKKTKGNRIAITTMAKIKKLGVLANAYELRFKDMELKANDIRVLSILSKEKERLVLRLDGEEVVTPAILKNVNVGQMCDEPKFTNLRFTGEQAGYLHDLIKEEKMIDISIEQDTDNLFPPDEMLAEEMIDADDDPDDIE